MNLGHRTKISVKGQVTIPEIIRQGFGISVGDELKWLEVLVDEENNLLFKVRIMKERAPEDDRSTFKDEEKPTYPIVQIQNALEELSEKQDIIISCLQSTKISKEDIAKRLREIIEKEGCITWSRVIDDEILPKRIKSREEYDRIMMQMLGTTNWKTEMLGNKRIYYREGFDIDKLKRQLQWRQLKWDDREVMEILKKHCDEVPEERINLDAFLRENFPQFTESDYNEARWKFMNFCKRNEHWGLVPVKIGQSYSDYVEKKKEEALR